MLKTAAGLYPYGLCAAASVVFFVLSGLLCARLSGNRSSKAAIGACGAEAVFALVLSRLVFCGSNYVKYFLYEPAKLPLLTEGGLSMWGALFGMLLGAFVFSRISRARAAALFDIMTPGALGVVVIMRLAEVFTGQSVGKEIQWLALSNTPFACLDDWGYPVFAVYRAEAFCALALIVPAFLLLRARTRPGAACVVCLSLLSAFQIVFECMKDSGYLYVYYIRITQALSVLMLLIMLIAGLLTLKKRRAAGWAAAFLLGCGIVVRQSFAIDTPERLELNLLVMLAGALLSAASGIAVYLRGEAPKADMPAGRTPRVWWAYLALAALVIALPFLIPSGMNI